MNFLLIIHCQSRVFSIWVYTHTHTHTHTFVPVLSIYSPTFQVFILGGPCLNFHVFAKYRPPFLEVVPDLGEPEDLPVTLTSSLSGEETNAMGGDDLVGEESNHNNEIFTSKDNLNLEPVKAAPTLDNSVEEIPATPPQPEEDEELGEPNVIGETSTAVSGSYGYNKAQAQHWHDFDDTEDIPTSACPLT